MAPITLRKLVAWHLLMVAALALCWMAPALWFIPIAVANLVPLMDRPSPVQRVSTLFSSAAIVYTIAGLGTFIISLNNREPNQEIQATVPPAFLWCTALVLAAMTSWRLIHRWRNPGSPEQRERSRRMYDYCCPVCQQPDAVEAVFLIPEPKLPLWNCPACGQPIRPALKHPVILILLHTIFLTLYLVVTGMGLCPLWVSVTGLLISHGSIQYLAGGLRIVPISRQEDFIEEEMK
jgi:hypothetical protein